MNLTVWSRRDPMTLELDRLREEMGRTFDRYLGEPTALPEPKLLRAEGWIPPLDVGQTETEMRIEVEVPGIGAKDLEISVLGDELTIAGKKEERKEQKDEDVLRCERRFGSFRRVIELPETVDTGRLTAESDNGVLTIRIPKRPEAKPRQVEVKVIGKKTPVGA